MIITPDRIKRIAKRLKRELADRAQPVPHMKCIEAVAAGFGFGSYAALLDSDVKLANWSSPRATIRLQVVAEVNMPRREIVDLITRAFDSAMGKSA